MHTGPFSRGIGKRLYSRTRLWHLLQGEGSHGERALAFHGQPLGLHLDWAVPQLFLILAFLCLFLLCGLVLGTDHASSWLHLPFLQPYGQAAGVSRKSDPPSLLEKQHGHTAGATAFLCHRSKITFYFHLSLSNQPCESLTYWPNLR